MSKLQIEAFQKSLQTGFIDRDIISEVLYQPQLLVNQKAPRKKVLTTIIQELNNCESFSISVAFVTTSGVASLINTFKALQEKGIKGKLLVSQYLNFTEPEALRRLSYFDNIELKIATMGNSHSKGYIFKTTTHHNLIVGSSNLTASALATNKEWNLKVSALNNSSIVEKTIQEFELDFENSISVTLDFIREYEEVYKRQRLVAEEDLNTRAGANKVIVPNSMQKEALLNISKLREDNRNKALLISATGTGKTFLSAFDAKAFNAKRLLFVVHRLNIAIKAMENFQNVFGKERTMGVYSGDKRELDRDFVFSTVQTISKASHLAQFNKNHFDYIIIDESHRSGAESYQRLIDFFKPKFLLGMTATPERTDGIDIFSLFDHNIAYEIRLNRAMEENMLSEFHYYGVTDITVNQEVLESTADFNRLTSDERVEKIISNAKFYGSDNGITRGLIFCSRNDEAAELSKKLNLKGYKTVALLGKNSEEERMEAIDRLESDSISQKLDYILTVDIFNEGIDIPKVNQILMIRPTNSAIVFIQQLGRGLRKVDGKNYLTVIDFIGNYNNNYLIPIALYGDKSYNKDSLRRLMSEGSRMLPGASTINFDEITKEKIFKSIDSANMCLLTDLKKDYNILKFKLGRMPMMMDFISHGERDPFSFIEHSKSYYNFISKADKEFVPQLTGDSVRLLELFSKEINNSKRVEESLILKELILNGQLSVTALKAQIMNVYEYEISNETIDSCLSGLNFEFIREKKEGKLLPVGDILKLNVVVLKNDQFEFHEKFEQLLKQEPFKMFLIDSVEYGITVFNGQYERSKWHNGFILYRKYSRKDVFRILNVAENPVAQNVGGYLVSPNNDHCPIFVNYHKDDHISESTKYEDEFLNSKEFLWMSKSNRKRESKDVKSILGENGAIRLPLFIKKNNDEGQDFYYMGDVSPKLNQTEQTSMKNDSGKMVSVVKILFNLKEAVSDALYNYLTSSNVIEINQADTLQIIDSQNPIEDDNKIEPINNFIPLYDFYAAAGAFSEMQSEKDYALIEAPERYSGTDYFACKIEGESMNRIIPNGSTCLFKIYLGGSRNGRVMIIENNDRQDPDFNSAFTIKTYSSEKVFNEDGTWQHDSIVLRPNSYDDTYKDIVLDEWSFDNLRTIGEFIMVLD
jgi:superfamily II DNA or RNA helicase